MLHKKNIISIHDYKLEYNPKTKRFHVKSINIANCPVCNNRLQIIGSRRRGVIKYGGEKIPLMIRRCYCEQCNKIHHELPDIIIPYKRYTSGAIEKIISIGQQNSEEDYCCDTSTVVRLKAWFFTLRDYIERALLTLRTIYKYDDDICKMISKLVPLKNYGKLSAGWLKTIVRMLVNTNRWVQTHSAF